MDKPDLLTVKTRTPKVTKANHEGRKAIKLNAELFWVFIAGMNYTLITELFEGTYFSNQQRLENHTLQNLFEYIHKTIKDANTILIFYDSLLKDNGGKIIIHGEN